MESVSTPSTYIGYLSMLTTEDIDWEYPGGNGADYKQVANWDQTYQIAAFPKLLAAIRAAIGKKLLSIAVPGKEGQSSYTCLKQVN